MSTAAEAAPQALQKPAVQFRTLTFGVSPFAGTASGRRVDLRTAALVRSFCRDAGNSALSDVDAAFRYYIEDPTRGAEADDVPSFRAWCRTNGPDPDGRNLADCARFSAMKAVSSVLAKRPWLEAVKNPGDAGDDPTVAAELALGHVGGFFVKRLRRAFGLTARGARTFLRGIANGSVPPAPLAVPPGAFETAFSAHVAAVRDRTAGMRRKADDNNIEEAERRNLLQSIRKTETYLTRLERNFDRPGVREAFARVRDVSRASAKALYSELVAVRSFRHPKKRGQLRQLIYGLFSRLLGDSGQFSARVYLDGLSDGLLGRPWHRGPVPVCTDLSPVRTVYVTPHPYDLKLAFLEPHRVDDAFRLPGGKTNPAGVGARYWPPALRTRAVGRTGLPVGDPDGPLALIPKSLGGRVACVLRPSHGFRSLLAPGALPWTVSDSALKWLVPSKKTGAVNIAVQCLFRVELPPARAFGTGNRLGVDVNRVGRFSAVPALQDGATGAIRALPPDEPIARLFKAHRRTLKLLEENRAEIRAKISHLQVALKKNHAPTLRDPIVRSLRVHRSLLSALAARTKKVKREHDLAVAEYIYLRCTAERTDELVFEDAPFDPFDLRGNLATIVSYMPKPKRLIGIIAAKAARAGHALKITFRDARGTSRYCHDCRVRDGVLRRIRRSGDRYTCPHCGATGLVHAMSAMNLLLQE